MAARPFKRLENSLILLDYLHSVFGGVKSFKALKAALGSYNEGYAADGHSFLYHRLIGLSGCSIPDTALANYDDNIRRHLKAINAARPAGEKIELKYFQLLALFYTEYVLHRAFLDTANFLNDLNAYVAEINTDISRTEHHFPSFKRNDLTKLAYWMATGSGKTLLLHLNYHQILHYTRLAGHTPFDSILLITPNAGLSEQHLAEFAKSGVPAERFKRGGSRGLAADNLTVQVLEITKFSKKGGPTTVSAKSFEGRNLVFVDEGHRGTSGDVWINIRNRLVANGGFTFEYSATFGQALNGGSQSKDYERRQEYGKAIVFDYSYKYFYGDGYGKDYQILNLPQNYSGEKEHADTLLLANILTFYEQMRLYDDLGGALRPYALEHPLLVFIGHTVQAGKTKSSLTREDKTSISDVLNLTRFLHRLLSGAGNRIENTMEAIFNGTTALKDDNGGDVFAGKFKYLREQLAAGLTIPALYDDLRQRFFHATGKAGLHLVNLKNADGEIGLRAGNSDRYFGVINIGDAANFLKTAEAKDLGFTFDEDALQGSLFNVVNQSRSPINVLLGAKKFVEGWSSWRVSSMGLLNVGKSEGSEIIQMFGRGVRLKGYDFSLKRSTALTGIAHPDDLPALETLNIFSINGNYLAKFKEYLEREGIATDFEEIAVPVEYQPYDSVNKKFAPAHTLYTIRPDDEFDFTEYPFVLSVIEVKSVDAEERKKELNLLAKIRPEFDLRPRLQTMTSDGNGTGGVNDRPTAKTIGAAALRLLDREAITTEIAEWKTGKGYPNLIISPTILWEIIDNKCYTLYVDDRLLNPKTFAGIARLQDVVIRILKAYIENFYKYHKQQAEAPHLAYRELDEQDRNLQLNELPDGSRGYLVKVPKNSSDPKILDAIDALKKLAKIGSDLYKKDIADLSNLNIHFDRHLYLPLLSAYGFTGTPPNPYTDQLSFIESITPVGLNQSETRFVLRLKEYLSSPAGKERLAGHHIYLLRNLSRGKGVGFFEAGNFYPDFILWVIDDKSQKIIFIDPKGLLMLNPNNFTHPKIQFAETIKDIESRLGRSDIQLESFIISETKFEAAKKTFEGRPNQTEFTNHHVLFFDVTPPFADTLLGSP